MAAASLTSRTSTVFGNQRVQQGTVTTMASGDTVTFRSMKTIRAINLAPTTAAAYGFTISGNVATLVSGGALTGLIQAIGS